MNIMTAMSTPRSRETYFAGARGLHSSDGATAPSRLRDNAAEGSGVVHLVDLDEEVSRRLRALFTSVGLRMRVHRDMDDFLGAVVPGSDGCLVVDARLALTGGRELRARLKPSALPVPVVVTASQADVPMAVEAMKAGAVDFLEKPFREQDMLDAVTAAMRAGRDIRLSKSRRAELQARFLKLTPREREVMLLVTSGRLNKQVAGDLGLSEITVKVHRGAAMRKMGARTLVDLVRMADAIADPAASAESLWAAHPLRIRS